MLATLGYAPARREGRRRRVLVPIALAAGLGVAGLVGWSHDNLGWPGEQRRAVIIDPRSADALVNQALVQKASGQAARATATLLDALAVAPKDPAAHYNLAVLYDESGERSRAVEHYRAFIDTAGPGDAARMAAVRSRLAALAR